MKVAIVGCGQLSRMMALAGIPLGVEFCFIKDDLSQDNRCINELGSIHDIPQNWQDAQQLQQWWQSLGNPDVITVEKEQVDIAFIRALNQLCPVYPNPDAIAVCQNRHNEKKTLAHLGIDSAAFVFEQSAAVVETQIGLPMVAKSCTEGYDGKNQWVLRNNADVEAFDASEHSNFIIEAFIPFQREVSQVSARDKQGNIKHYPITENVHQNGILKRSIAPAPGISQALTKAAQEAMEKLLVEMDYVGVLAIEFFDVNGRLMVNELAPRVHNSGHWTQLGSLTCQFENHVRAITGQALGDVGILGKAGMFNLIGNPLPDTHSLSAAAKLNWYNKTVKPNRKLGHINCIADSYERLNSLLDDIDSKV
ncbi:5-(carboxyamino)imidazole ribonucleotide synthase [Paraferrimonas haliotis]|uniref:N5-carboxyaminoimidazole ribonucleotide synthase n=1 Tax=Paraferrimonas haliotis TaxID=2013866 RepID=A0AA37TU67_9GAMM|nr:5-(carboxyamino)imidazole ribonucleotide synthase [Paraferrimonas haliotis]GLS83004.1 N5-carboxyaminoimidazole ribonucleotide synthase [Paraferrimonas haliotis]